MMNTGDAATARSRIILAEVDADVASLVAGLTDDDESIRILALGGLHRLESLDMDHLRRALEDTHRDVRCRALELSIDHPDIDLTPFLGDIDDLVVETAAFALGEREQATPHIIAALSGVAMEHEVSICREAAIAALGALGDDTGLPAIFAGLADRAAVRRRAVLALAPFDNPEVTAALERATEDRDRQVRQAAEDLL